MEHHYPTRGSQDTTRGRCAHSPGGSVREENIVLRALRRDRDTAREEVACLNVSRRMLQNVTSSDKHLVTKGVSPQARDPDRQRLVLDNLSTVRPHDDRATRSKATTNHFQRPSTLSGHSTVGAFRHQDRDLPGLENLLK